MTGRPRPPRRQGVVYGPPSFRQSSGSGSVYGRLVGGLVVLGALAVLTVGALSMLGDRGRPSASATPSLAALATPSPSAVATRTPPAAATPSPTVALTPSPSPTPFLVELVEGPGKITFASNYTNDLELVDPRVVFALDDQMAWRANIGEAVGRVQVNFDVYRVDPATLAETLVHSSTFVGKNADARFYYAKAPVEREVDGPGIFVMRYSVDGATISEGFFQVIE